MNIVILTLDNEGDQTTKFEKVYDWVHFRDFPKVANKIVEQQELTYDRNSEKVYVSYGLNFNVNGTLSSEGTSYSLPSTETNHVVAVKL